LKFGAATLRSLIITKVRDQARATRSFDLMPEGEVENHGVSFVPGQVAILEVPGEAPAYFAFAGAPEDPELEVLVTALRSTIINRRILFSWRWALE
jgi:hypothetical protein